MKFLSEMERPRTKRTPEDKTNATRRAKLFHKQEGKCYWCELPMLLIKPPAKMEKPIRNMCTLDHLDDRFSPERGKHGGELRTVAACWQCNWNRNKQREKELPREILQAASRHKVM